MMGQQGSTSAAAARAHAYARKVTSTWTDDAPRGLTCVAHEVDMYAQAFYACGWKATHRDVIRARAQQYVTLTFHRRA